MMNATLRGKPDAGNPHVRFDEGEVAPAKPRRGSLLYNKLALIGGLALHLSCAAASTVLQLESREYSPHALSQLISGRSDVVVRSPDAAHPAMVTGGRRISGWTVGKDGVWRVTLSDVRAGRWNFSQLFVNGARRFRPRVPARGWYAALAPANVVTNRAHADYGVGGFIYGGDVLDPNWANRADLEMQMLFRRNGARMRIRSIDPAAHLVTLTAPYPGLAAQHNPREGRFAVENVKEAFGAPGEWYLDRPTGELAYTPLAGETPERCVVEAPFDATLLELRNVRNVMFENIVFRLDNATTPCDRSLFTPQGEIGSPSAIRVCASSRVAFRGCRFQNLGGWALFFDEGCLDCSVSGCVLTDLGAGGVLLGSRDKAAVRTTVEDTEIVGYGRRDPGAPGIMAIQSAEGRFIHNHIHDGYYTGISIGWGWRVEKVPTSYRNEIGHNHIHDIGQGQLSDMGLVYLLCRQPGTRVHHNHLHDVRFKQYGATGIYPDECSAEEEIDHNYVCRAGTKLLHCNMVRDLDIHDNVFIEGGPPVWDFSNNIGEEENLIRLHRNVFVWNGGRSAVRNRSFKATKEQRAAYNVPFWKGLDLAENVYWTHSGDPRVFPPADIRSETASLLTLAEFQAASGQERSSVFRDPGEIDPLRVCGETGVRPGVVTAVAPRPERAAPFGLDEQYVVQGVSREIDMNDGMATSLGKLKRGGDFTVAYFGGSITEGASYRPLVTDWLRRTYPQTRIREINAAIGGTGSNLGVYRLERDVLRQNPDLVFVEFALNDSDRSSVEPDRIGACVESIIRQIWTHDPTTDIVFLHTISCGLANTFRRGILTREAAIYNTLATRYRIPVVNFAPRVVALERAGRLVWTLGLAPTAVPKEDPDYEAKVAAEMAAQGKLVFSNDGVHPRPEGGALYYAALTNFLSQTMPEPYAWNRPNLVALRSYDPCPILSPKSVELSRELLAGSWRPVATNDATFGRFLARTDSMWASDRPGDRLAFEFEGAEVALYALYGPSGARLRVKVDGQARGVRDLFDRYCTYWRLMRVPIFRGVCGRHRVEIEIAAEQPDREIVRSRRKLTPEQCAAIGFDGHHAAIGRLFIDGEMRR